ncbi:MAG TPA: 2-phospho-L-lactate transferase [Acidimicrobiia bacterium]|jgi:LPPG:FO 2-phospho-L-lactate transferase
MKVVELSGGVGGARMARGLAALEHVDLTVVVNVGDDLPTHGLYVAPDLDTVAYTLAGMEGPHGWGRDGDTFVTNNELARFGLDIHFQLGDLDLALKIFRTHRINGGSTLSEVTDSIRSSLGIATTILPVTDDPVRTRVTTTEDLTLTFQEYFVDRRHRDRVKQLEFDGADVAHPAPGVLEAIESADVLIIGPSNPPLSIWPIIAVGGVEQAVRGHPRVIAVSPLIGGKALRGPADLVLADLGLGSGTSGVLAAYRELIDVLVVDTSDQADAGEVGGVTIVALDTHIAQRLQAERLARAILSL